MLKYFLSEMTLISMENSNKSQLKIKKEGS